MKGIVFQQCRWGHRGICLLNGTLFALSSILNPSLGICHHGSPRNFVRINAFGLVLYHFHGGIWCAFEHLEILEVLNIDFFQPCSSRHDRRTKKWMICDVLYPEYVCIYLEIEASFGGYRNSFLDLSFR